ncbi:MAG: PVC-type heme-binding CxxCH protein [Planctomycetaceae bacterium]
MVGLSGFHLYASMLIVALSAAFTSAEEVKRLLMIAGKPSHGYGSHEHYAGLQILAENLKASGQKVDITVTRGWPTDESLVSQADTIVIYSDGGGGHPALPHRDDLKAALAKGAGFVCLHYATEVPKGPEGDDWLAMLGGNFETHWSVNPHWIAKFDSLPKHPVTQGVKPFAANDEWYFHLRFAPAPAKVTPILQAIAPAETMRRPDGPHSGNPDVRKSVAAGEPQTVAWVYERPDGGRSFGFTGGHYHWNWGNPSILKLVSNAILWTAKGTVPETGVELQPVDMETLLKNQDYPPPKNFDAEKTAEEFSIGAPPKDHGAGASLQPQQQGKSRLIYTTPVITTQTSRHRIDIDTDLNGAKDLYLVVTDAGDGYACDWADWIDPVIYGDGRQQSLVELSWESATSGWGQVRKNLNANGEPIRIRREKIDSPSIGTHANSVIHYRVPEGFTHFRATAGIDSGGSNQNEGKSTSIRFSLYAGSAPDVDAIEASSGDAQHDPANAVAGLEVGDGLEVTLSASEPELRSLTNLDIDDQGRVWVCDVMNYRGNSGSRREGDRILILEDTDADGVMDKSKVFYQGRDIDSAMGICLVGNDVIVSAAPYIWRFTDNNGDDVPDSKVAMFTDTGQPQHDHSNHSFVFGPDGKLYWNFGNTGKHVKDAQGRIVVDIHGREVIDNGKPFFGGMPFRCNLDGSEFEVLAHNFRNNWETAVDSFGTLWQSDNDDDGNRGTRINFVMEHGNYGYRDEMTGANWQSERINMESDIPLRHWHLNDPGVVPNVLQTGAGSPSGMCLYEGTLLPARFHNQMIHCDPGPNMVRAFPVKPQGAGYSAVMDPLMTGLKDKWFRPADVCTAPDGSLFVTDWYDPGVGGHRQEDINRGRLFRIAPPGTKYQVPKFDYTTVEGAIDALRSPTLAVRSKAWLALHAMGDRAEAGLLALYADANPRLRARALWLLGKIEGRGEHYVRRAIGDDHADIRITGIRLMRQLKLDPAGYLAGLVDDESPAVRREALIALRYDRGDQMPTLWAKLASHYDGDRWYLEALGLASDLRAVECYDAYRKSLPDELDSNGRDIVWRLRAPAAADALVKIIADPAIELSQTDRYFRALEFHPPEVRSKALAALMDPKFVNAAAESDRAKHDAVIVRALERMNGSGYADQPMIQAVVNRYVESRKGTPEYLKLVKQFRPEGHQSALLELALAQGDDTASVEAMRMLAQGPQGPGLIRNALESNQGAAMLRLIRLLGMLGTDRASKSLMEVAANAELPYDARAEAVRGLAKSNLGATGLLDLASSGKLPGDTRLLAGGLLGKLEDKAVRARAEKLFPMPSQADLKPLPPLDELAGMKGDSARGESLFRTTATCANCHIVNGFGKQVGPDLSEIGTKLSREAMFTSILDPSAGVSHNYENFVVLLESGQVVAGVKVSETQAQLSIRTADAIDRTFNRDEIVEVKQSDKSIMPENLHQLFDQQGLVDIVEYMTTLTKK